MTCCAAINCSNRDARENREKGMTFHKFPCNKPDQLEKWLNNMKRVEPSGKLWMPSKSTKLCSEHFTPECFDRTGQTTRLRADAVPTIFDFTKQPDKLTTKRVKALLRASLPIEMETPPSPSASETKEESVANEHCYATCHSPKKFKRQSDDSDKIDYKISLEDEHVDGGSSPRSSSTSSSFEACNVHRHSVHGVKGAVQEDLPVQMSQNQTSQVFTGPNNAYAKSATACISCPDGGTALPTFGHDRKRVHVLSLLDRKSARGKFCPKDKESPRDNIEDPSHHFGIVTSQKYPAESPYALYGKYVAERLEKLRQQASEKTVMILQNRIDNLIHGALVEAMPDTVDQSKIR